MKCTLCNNELRISAEGSEICETCGTDHIQVCIRDAQKHIQEHPEYITDPVIAMAIYLSGRLSSAPAYADIHRVLNAITNASRGKI